MADPEQLSKAPTTTVQQDITMAGQRKINIVWEYTQATVALAVTAALIYVSINKIESPDLKNAFFLIVGFYFSRTNHQAIGSIGPKATDDAPYVGR